MEDKSKNPILKVLLLDIGEFGLGAFICLITFFLLLIALNYFNIISLSSLYAPLAVLPRQTIPQQTTKNTINPSPNTSKSTLNTTLSIIEKQKLNSFAQNFVDSLLLPNYRTRVQLDERLLVKGIAIPSLVDSWSNNSFIATLSAQYDYRKRAPVILDVIISIPKDDNLISEVNINQLLSKYLILATDAKLSCSQPNIVSNLQCHSMATQNDNSKVGISLWGYSIKDLKHQSIYVVSLCKVLPESNRYSWTTCLHE